MPPTGSLLDVTESGRRRPDRFPNIRVRHSITGGNVPTVLDGCIELPAPVKDSVEEHPVVRRTCFLLLTIVLPGFGCRSTPSSPSVAARPRTAAPVLARPVGGEASSLASQVELAAFHPASQSADGPPLDASDGAGAEPPVVGEPLPTPVPGNALTLDELERLALQNNPRLAQALARVDAARGRWLQVGLPPNFRLAYSSSEIGNEGKAGQQGGYAAQEFVTGGKLRLNRQMAAWEVERLQRDLDVVRLRVLTDLRIAYYDVLIAQRRRKLARELVRISEEGVKAAEALFQGEEVSEADPLRAKVAAQSARIVLQNALNQHRAAWRRLTAVLGMPDLAIQTIDGRLDVESMSVESWDDELQRILRESPEMAAAMAQVEAARWGIERAYAERVPNVDVQATVQKDMSSGYTISGLQVEIPIPLLNRNQGGIQRAQAEAMAAELELDRLSLDLQARLAPAFQRYQNARNQVQQYSRKDGILDNSERTLELVRAGYRAEEFGILDLLNAQRVYFQTNLAYLDSLRELLASVMEIRGMLARPSEGR